MSLAPQASARRESPRVPEIQTPNFHDLKTPRPQESPANNPEQKKRDQPKQPERNPSHFAPENPTNKELAKERWYTRAACANIAIAYPAALYGILYGTGEPVTRLAITGLLIDTVFSFWALKNSEMRKFILDGSILPNPVHSDTVIRRALAIGGVFQFLGSLSNTAYATSLLLEAQYPAAIFRSAVALTSLHLGFAWLRRVRFFGSLDSQ